MVSVEVISPFVDLLKNTSRNMGDVFECDENRAKELIEKKFCKKLAEEKAERKQTKKG